VGSVIAQEGDDSMFYKVPLVLTPQPEGGFVVTSPVLPELITEGDTVEDAIENASDCLGSVIEIYEDLGRSLPPGLKLSESAGPIEVETLVAAL
jgi:antitoxin HicB